MASSMRRASAINDTGKMQTMLHYWGQPHMRNVVFGAATLLLFCFIFLVDVNTPRSVADGYFYIVTILLTFPMTGRLVPFINALVALTLIVIGFFFSDAMGVSLSSGLINRGGAIATIWLIATLVYLMKARQRSLEENARNLENSKNFLEAVLSTVIDGIITIDENGIIQSFNPSARRIFGYRLEEVVGRNVKVLMPEPYHSEHDSYLQNYLRTGKEKVIGIGREVSAQKKDGSVFPMELGINAMRISGKTMFVGTIRDISDRKRAEEELLRSNEELERFAYIASHDLQEPLRMVSNFTMLLEGEYGKDLDPQARKYMSFIVDAASRMQDLVGDLLEYSRIGYEEAGYTSIDCRAQTEIALHNLSEVINETSATIKIGELPVIMASPMRFTRLMQNLIGNAIKYRRPGANPEISITATDQGDSWRFSVSDNGIGIKQEYLEQIFVIFKRLHSKKEYKGTGIGLAVCKKIVESFEGRIWAEPNPGQGTTFHFTTPKAMTMKKAA